MLSNARKDRPAMMPTHKELAALPRRARVAFAARCARRAWHLLAERWPFTAVEATCVLGSLVTAAEDAAAGQGDVGPALACQVELAKDVCMEAAGEALDCLVNVADVVVYALETGAEEDTGRSSTRACSAALAARLVLGVDARGDDDMPMFKASAVAIRRDLDRLLDAASRLGWTNGTCVPADWFDDFDQCSELTSACPVPRFRSDTDR